MPSGPEGKLAPSWDLFWLAPGADLRGSSMGVERWCIEFPLLWGRRGWEFRGLWQPEPKPEGFPPAFTDGSANQRGCPSTNNDVA